MSNATKYPASIRILHWAIALLILGLISSGWYMAELPKEAPNKYPIYFWHKSFGVLTLIGIFLRVGVRIRHQLAENIPPAPKVLKQWEKAASHLAHLCLYGLMLAVPISGYIMSGSYIDSHGIDFFGLKLPDLVEKNETVFNVFHTLHGPLAFFLLALVIIHIAAVIKHKFIDDKNADVLPRML